MGYTRVRDKKEKIYTLYGYHPEKKDSFWEGLFIIVVEFLGLFNDTVASAKKDVIKEEKERIKKEKEERMKARKAERAAKKKAAEEARAAAKAAAAAGN